jgi:hypothetical protein
MVATRSQQVQFSVSKLNLQNIVEIAAISELKFLHRSIHNLDHMANTTVNMQKQNSVIVWKYTRFMHIKLINGKCMAFVFCLTTNYRFKSIRCKTESFKFNLKTKQQKLQRNKFFRFEFTQQSKLKFYNIFAVGFCFIIII